MDCYSELSCILQGNTSILAISTHFYTAWMRYLSNPSCYSNKRSHPCNWIKIVRIILLSRMRLINIQLNHWYTNMVGWSTWSDFTINSCEYQRYPLDPLCMDIIIAYTHTSIACRILQSGFELRILHCIMLRFTELWCYPYKCMWKFKVL